MKCVRGVLACMRERAGVSEGGESKVQLLNTSEQEEEEEEEEERERVSARAQGSKRARVKSVQRVRALSSPVFKS